MKSNYLLYFCNGIGSVFDSQVLALLNSIADKKLFKKAYLILGIKNEDEKKEFRKRKIDDEIGLIFYKSYPNYPFYNLLQRKSISKAIKDIDIDFHEAILHTRGELIAWHLTKLLNKVYHKSIIPDIRGASIEEVEDFYDISRIKKAIKIYNYKNAIKSLHKFSKVSVVSNSLKDHLANKYKIDPQKLVITSSLSGKKFRFDEALRARKRKELNLIDDDILLVFSSGGIANWQNNNVIMVLAEKGLKVLNLSKKVIQHKNIINKFVSYNEMPSYLNAADIAVIWRDKSTVNKVASPVKFSEYICCGLPIIANDSVDMINEYLTSNSCGLLIDSLDEIDLNSLNQLRQKSRQAIAESGIYKFGINTIAKSYCRTYSILQYLRKL